MLISTTLLKPFILPLPGKLLTVLQGSVCLSCLSLFTSFWRYLCIGSNIYEVSFAFPGSVGECVDSNNWSIEPHYSVPAAALGTGMERTQPCPCSQSVSPSVSKQMVPGGATGSEDESSGGEELCGL